MLEKLLHVQNLGLFVKRCQKFQVTFYLSNSAIFINYMSQEILQFFLKAGFFGEHNMIKVVSYVWSGVIVYLSLAYMVESVRGLRGSSLPLRLLQF